MVAIRSRSKMELGRRLSSSTQKQMKQENRTITSLSFRNENQTIHKSDDPPSSPTIIDNPYDTFTVHPPSISNNLNNNLSITEPGQCFCSTCQTYDGDDNNSLWELQETSSIEKHFSFAHIKPISMIFSSRKNSKEKQNHLSEDLCKSTLNNMNSIEKPLTVPDNMKYSIVINANDHTETALTSTKQSVSKTSSVNSSFSDDFTPTEFMTSNKKQKKSKHKKRINLYVYKNENKFFSRFFLFIFSRQRSTTSDNSPPISSRLKVPSITTTTSHPIITITDDSLPNSPQHKTTKMNFFTFLNTLINPSHSSSLQKELKAARQLGMLVGVFTVSWLPYFILFLVVAWCDTCVSETVYTASIWLGYLNSTFNPLIYPLCNIHFRRAFQKICYCKHAKTKLPNLNALRELHTLHTTVGRRR